MDRAHIQIEAFLFAEHAGTQAVTQTFGDDKRGIFSGLRQQHHEFVAAVTKRVVD